MCIATKPGLLAPEREPMQGPEPWHGHCQLQFNRDASDRSRHQGGCSAPFKLMRAEAGDNGRCELPLLHTATACEEVRHLRGEADGHS